MPASMIREETDEEYHAADGISKSGLWTLWTKTPFHYRYVEHEDKPHFQIGKAAHIAILEPETLEARVGRGPADRRGNKWKEFLDYCERFKLIPLIEEDHNTAMRIRDLAAGVPELRLMQEGTTIVETSAYALDEEHGLMRKTRPDMYNLENRLIVDIKNMADASPSAFAKAVSTFGYHVQDASYTDIWTAGSKHEVDGFFFVVFEKSTPPTVAVYELDAPTVREGHAIYRAAMAKYAECAKAGRWPSYEEGMKTIGLRSRWDYKLTTPPEGL
jgi:exodeoxyribonuclease VIII